MSISKNSINICLKKAIAITVAVAFLFNTIFTEVSMGLSVPTIFPDGINSQIDILKDAEKTLYVLLSKINGKKIDDDIMEKFSAYLTLENGNIYDFRSQDNRTDKRKEGKNWIVPFTLTENGIPWNLEAVVAPDKAIIKIRPRTVIADTLARLKSFAEEIEKTANSYSGGFSEKDIVIDRSNQDDSAQRIASVKQKIIERVAGRAARTVRGTEAVHEVEWLFDRLAEYSNVSDPWYKKSIATHLQETVNVIRKIDENASAELLIAGMLHDVGRFFDGHYVRMDDLPQPYNGDLFKKYYKPILHPILSESIARPLLEELGIDPVLMEKVSILIKNHETGISAEGLEPKQISHDFKKLIRDSSVLKNADSISIFSPFLMVNRFKDAEERNAKGEFPLELDQKYTRSSKESQRRIDNLLEDRKNEYLKDADGRAAYAVFLEVQKEASRSTSSPSQKEQLLHNDENQKLEKKSSATKIPMDPAEQLKRWNKGRDGKLKNLIILGIFFFGSAFTGGTSIFSSPAAWGILGAVLYFTGSIIFSKVTGNKDPSGSSAFAKAHEKIIQRMKEQKPHLPSVKGFIVLSAIFILGFSIMPGNAAAGNVGTNYLELLMPLDRTSLVEAGYTDEAKIDEMFAGWLDKFAAEEHGAGTLASIREEYARRKGRDMSTTSLSEIADFLQGTLAKIEDPGEKAVFEKQVIAFNMGLVKANLKKGSVESGHATAYEAIAGGAAECYAQSRVLEMLVRRCGVNALSLTCTLVIDSDSADGTSEEDVDVIPDNHVVNVFKLSDGHWGVADITLSGKSYNLLVYNNDEEFKNLSQFYRDFKVLLNEEGNWLKTHLPTDVFARLDAGDFDSEHNTEKSDALEESRRLVLLYQSQVDENNASIRELDRQRAVLLAEQGSILALFAAVASFFVYRFLKKKKKGSRNQKSAIEDKTPHENMFSEEKLRHDKENWELGGMDHTGQETEDTETTVVKELFGEMFDYVEDQFGLSSPIYEFLNEAKDPEKWELHADLGREEGFDEIEYTMKLAAMSIKELLGEYAGLDPDEFISKDLGLTLPQIDKTYFCGHLIGRTVAKIETYKGALEHNPEILDDDPGFKEIALRAALFAEKKLLLFREWAYRHWDGNSKKRSSFLFDLEEQLNQPLPGEGPGAALRNSSEFDSYVDDENAPGKKPAKVQEDKTLIDTVFEGGGAKGVAYGGALDVVAEKGLWFRRVAGTSAGAITASLIAVGYDHEEIRTIIMETNFKDFKDLKWGFLPTWLNMIIFGGMYAGNYFEKWIDKKFEEKLGFSPTMKDLPIPLTLIASNISDKQKLILDAETAPALKVSTAVRMSMGIPFFFNVFRWFGSYKNIIKIRRVVDGGILSNFPLSVLENDREHGVPVLGFRVQQIKAKKKHKIFRNIVLGLLKKIPVVDIAVNVLETGMDANDNKHIEDDDWARIVNISVDVGTTEFDLTPAKKEELMERGRVATEKVLDKKLTEAKRQREAKTSLSHEEKHRPGEGPGAALRNSSEFDSHVDDEDIPQVDQVREHIKNLTLKKETINDEEVIQASLKDLAEGMAESGFGTGVGRCDIPESLVRDECYSFTSKRVTIKYFKVERVLDNDIMPTKVPDEEMYILSILDKEGVIGHGFVATRKESPGEIFTRFSIHGGDWRAKKDYRSRGYGKEALDIIMAASFKEDLFTDPVEWFVFMNAINPGPFEWNDPEETRRMHNLLKKTGYTTTETEEDYEHRFKMTSEDDEKLEMPLEEQFRRDKEHWELGGLDQTGGWDNSFPEDKLNGQSQAWKMFMSDFIVDGKASAEDYFAGLERFLYWLKNESLQGFVDNEIFRVDQEMGSMIFGSLQDENAIGLDEGGDAPYVFDCRNDDRKELANVRMRVWGKYFYGPKGPYFKAFDDLNQNDESLNPMNLPGTANEVSLKNVSGEDLEKINNYLAKFARKTRSVAQLLLRLPDEIVHDLEEIEDEEELIQTLETLASGNAGQTTPSEEDFSIKQKKEAVNLIEMIGPVTLGPSSSHTAGVYKIGSIFKEILSLYKSSEIRDLSVTFKGSLGATGKNRGSDRAFAAGFLGRDMEEAEYYQSAPDSNIIFSFDPSLKNIEHPDTVIAKCTLETGAETTFEFASIGGGIVHVISVNGTKLRNHQNGYIIFKHPDTNQAKQVEALISDVINKEAGYIRVMKLPVFFFIECENDSSTRKKTYNDPFGIPFAIIEPAAWQRGSETFSIDKAVDILEKTHNTGLSLYDFFLGYQFSLSLHKDDPTTEEKTRQELEKIWQAMKSLVSTVQEDNVPGNDLHNLARDLESDDQMHPRLLSSLYAYHISKRSSEGKKTVCAPTAGASGILPGALLAIQEKEGVSDGFILEALLVAAGIGAIIKNRASIAGAEVGCQGETGTACAMTAAAITYLHGGNNKQIMQAASLALSFNLGKICDPLGGHTSWPCCIRNATEATLAWNASERVLSGKENDLEYDLDLEALRLNKIGRRLHQDFREMGYAANMSKNKVTQAETALMECLQKLENITSPEKKEKAISLFLETIQVRDPRIVQSLKSGLEAYNEAWNRTSDEIVALNAFILAVNSFLGINLNTPSRSDEAAIVNAETAAEFAISGIMPEVSLAETINHLLTLNASDRNEIPKENIPPAAEIGESSFTRNTRIKPYISEDAEQLIEGILAPLLPNECSVLDLMSGFNTYVPDSVQAKEIIGIGLNEGELAKNQRLTGFLVQDLNENDQLPIEWDERFGAAIMVSGMAYLHDPEYLFSEVAATLAPGGILFISYNEGYHEDEATAKWKTMDAATRIESTIEAIRSSGKFNNIKHEVRQYDELDLVNPPKFLDIITARKNSPEDETDNKDTPDSKEQVQDFMYWIELARELSREDDTGAKDPGSHDNDLPEMDKKMSLNPITIDSPFTNNMEEPEGVASSFVDKLLSILTTKKVVLLFEDGIGGANSNMILDVLEEIERLKKDPKYKGFLKNLVVKKTSSKKISRTANKYLDANTEVFVFARTSTRQDLKNIESMVHSTYINETEYDWDMYYPLAEMVTIALSQYLDPDTMDDIKSLLKDLNIAAELPLGGSIIFTLLPDAAKYDRQDLIKKYAALKRALISA